MSRAKRSTKTLNRRTWQRSQRKTKRARRTEPSSSQSTTDQTDRAVETTGDEEVDSVDDESSGDDDDEDEESGDSADTGDASMALQQLQSLMKRTERKDNFEKNFKKKIRDEERRLLRLLEEEKKRRKAEVEEFQSRFASIAAKALVPPGCEASPAHEGKIQANISPENHPLHARSQALIKRCDSITKGYERLTKHASKVEPLPDLERAWNQDYEKLKRLAVLGQEASELEIKSLLTYNGEDESRSAKRRRKAQKDKFKNESHLQAMLEMGREALSEQERGREVRGWRVVAHRAEKGLQEMVKALPDDEGMNSEGDSQL